MVGLQRRLKNMSIFGRSRSRSRSSSRASRSRSSSRGSRSSSRGRSRSRSSSRGSRSSSRSRSNSRPKITADKAKSAYRTVSLHALDANTPEFKEQREKAFALILDTIQQEGFWGTSTSQYNSTAAHDPASNVPEDDLNRLKFTPETKTIKKFLDHAQKIGDASKAYANHMNRRIPTAPPENREFYHTYVDDLKISWDAAHNGAIAAFGGAGATTADEYVNSGGSKGGHDEVVAVIAAIADAIVEANKTGAAYNQPTVDTEIAKIYPAMKAAEIAVKGSAALSAAAEGIALIALCGAPDTRVGGDYFERWSNGNPKDNSTLEAVRRAVKKIAAGPDAGLLGYRGATVIPSKINAWSDIPVFKFLDTKPMVHMNIKKGEHHCPLSCPMTNSITPDMTAAEVRSIAMCTYLAKQCQAESKYKGTAPASGNPARPDFDDAYKTTTFIS